MNNRKTLLLTTLLAISAALYAQNAGDFEIRDRELVSYRGNAAEVVVPDGVTEIWPNAFNGGFKNGCKRITRITLPASVTTIGVNAFQLCTNLTSINIPAKVTRIGGISSKGVDYSEDAFNSCTMLVRITVDEGNAVFSSIDGVLFNKAKTALLKYPSGRQGNPYVVPASVTYIGENALSFSWNLTSVTIPASVTSIGKYAFNQSEGLTSVTVGAATIGERAFNHCKKLARVSMLPGVRTIEEKALYNCESLVSITIPNGVTFIGRGAFDGCSRLTSANIPDSVTQIGYDAFSRTALSNQAKAEIDRRFETF